MDYIQNPSCTRILPRDWKGSPKSLRTNKLSNLRVYSLLKKIVQKPKEIYFEFTSSDNTQKNGVKEWEFATLYSFMQASMSHTFKCNNLNTDLCPEYAATMNKFKFFSKPNQICLMRSSTVRLHTMQNI